MLVCIGTAIPDLSRFADRRTLGVPSSCPWALRNRSMSIPACCRTACTIWPQFAASFPGSVSWWTPYCLLTSCLFTWRPSSQVLTSSTRLCQSQVILLKSSETCDLCFFLSKFCLLFGFKAFVKAVFGIARFRACTAVKFFKISINQTCLYFSLCLLLYFLSCLQTFGSGWCEL